MVVVFLQSCTTGSHQPTVEQDFDVLEAAPRYQFFSSGTTTPAVSTTSAAASDFWQRAVSVHFDDIGLAQALRGLSTVYQFRYALEHRASTPVSYQGHGIPLSMVISSLAQQAGMVVDWSARKTVLRRDAPYWHNHQAPYLNIQRKSVSRVALSQNIGNPSQGGSRQAEDTVISNTFEHTFWKNIAINLKRLLRTSADNHLIINKEAGVVSTWGDAQVQRAVAAFLEQVLRSHQRQVMIEISVLEVELSEQHQQGIDWSLVSGDVNLSQQLLGSQINSAPRGLLSLTARSGTVSAAFMARWMSRFGDTRVLSTPRLQVMNNQTAILKVVNNNVYFTVDSVTAVNQSGSTTNFDTQVNSVAVGLVLSLTPYVDDSGNVLLNLRPSISRISGFVSDPHPLLAQQGVRSTVPVIQERELESVLRVRSGEMTVIGGLIQQRNSQNTDNLAGLRAFGYEQKTLGNTELVLLIRPLVLP